MLLPSALFVLLCILQLAACTEDFYKVCIHCDTFHSILQTLSLVKLLGIDKQASDREIKRAYRTLSKKYHPDKNPYEPSYIQVMWSF